MSAPLWIVIVNYNGWPDTRKCLQSVARVPDSTCVTVLVDNASQEDPTPLVGREFPWCQVLRNRTNLGLAGGNNTGIRYAMDHGAKLVLMLNNDTIVSPHLPQRLVAAAETHPEFGILGPIINSMDEPEEVMTDGCIFNSTAAAGFFHRQTVPPLETTPPAVAETDIVNGACLMATAQVFRRIGLIDERFFLIHEESDFCLRARRAGFRCGIVAEPLVWHKRSQTFQQKRKRLQRYYDARNLLLLLWRHQGTHRRGRAAWQSAWEYVKYVYYRYAVEQENGLPENAAGVIEGLYDALLGRYGPFQTRPRLALPLLARLFEWQHRRRSAPLQ